MPNVNAASVPNPGSSRSARLLTIQSNNIAGNTAASSPRTQTITVSSSIVCLTRTARTGSLP